MHDFPQDKLDILVMAAVVGLLTMILVCGCAPSPQVTPVAASSPVDLFSQLGNMADGGRFSITLKESTIDVGSGVELCVPGTLSGVTRQNGETIVVEFNRPFPAGKTRKLGLSFQAGIESIEITRNQISAVTDAFGKRFTWELKETP